MKLNTFPLVMALALGAIPVRPALAAQDAPVQETAQAPPAESQTDATALAKQTQNPVSDLITVPLQINFNSGGGLDGDTALLMNFQPVIPIKLTDQWNLIARGIVPVLDNPAGDSRRRGLGDTQTQLFLTPAKPGGLIWGVGPTLSFPTATTVDASTGSWALGPNAVALTMAGPWVMGILGSYLWTYADEGGDPEVDLLAIQPFVNFNFGKGWALSTSPLITANFNASDGQEWTVPLGAGVTKTTKVGGQHMNLGVQYYRNVTHPDAAAANQLRVIVALLFPTRH